MRNIRQHELFALEQGDLLVTKYELESLRLDSLCMNLYFLEDVMVMTFESHLQPKYKDLVSSRRLHASSDVVDSAKVIEKKKMMNAKKA